MVASAAAPVVASAASASAGTASYSGGLRSNGVSGGTGTSSSRTETTIGPDEPGRTCLTCPKWRYRMGIRQLGSVLGISWHHLFVVEDEVGRRSMPTYSAFPSVENGDPGMLGPILGKYTSDSSKDVEDDHVTDPEDESDMGYLRPQFAHDYYRSGEYDPTNRFVVLDERDASLGMAMLRYCDVIEARRITYEATGPNSNSFAMSLAEAVGLPRRKPSGDAPGSGITL